MHQSDRYGTAAAGGELRCQHKLTGGRTVMKVKLQSENEALAVCKGLQWCRASGSRQGRDASEPRGRRCMNLKYCARLQMVFLLCAMTGEFVMQEVLLTLSQNYVLPAFLTRNATAWFRLLALCIDESATI